jgi:Fe-S-cluster containining protein
MEQLEDDAAARIERSAYRERLDVFLACRDTAQELTQESLKTGIQLRAVVSAAAGVARYVDEALAIVDGAYRPALDCREGCSYCCQKPGVLTSIPELVRIVDHVRATFAADAVSELAARARRYSGQIAGRSFNDPVDEAVPCPLLAGGRCSVYDVRPLTCRGYNSTSVDACRRASSNAGVMIPMFAPLKDATDGATVGAAQALEAAGLNAALVDLGSALGIALAAGDGFAESAIAGGDALSGAEDSSIVGELWARVRATAQQVGVTV